MKKQYNSIIATVAAGILSASANPASAASIAFTGFNADGLDNLSFVTLESIAPGTTIFLADQEWNGSPIGGGGAFNTGESGFQWTSPAFALGAGTVISINDINNTNNPTSNFGDVTFHDGANKGVSNSDEGIYAYFGAAYAPTSFLAIIGNDIEANAGSAAGTGLGVNKLYIAGDEDIMAYVGPRSGLTSFADYLPFLTDSANWITQDGGGDQGIDGTNPDVPFDTTVFTIVPEPSAMAVMVAGLASVAFLRRRIVRQ